METVEILQTLSAVAGLLGIMTGSLYLKKALKRYGAKRSQRSVSG